MIHFEMHSPQRAPLTVQTFPLSGGDRGVEQTIQAMRRLIDAGKKDPQIHELAAEILRNSRVPAFDWMGEVRAIGEWVGRRIRFTRDVYGKETLHTAPEIVRLGIGDCDDFTVLICSLLGTIGVKTRIVTISSPRLDPSQFTHVFPEAEVDGRWIPVDFARREPRFGMGPQTFSRRREWSTSSDQFVDVQGLTGPAPRRSPFVACHPRGAMRRTAVAPPNTAAAYLRGGAPNGYFPNALPGAYRPGANDPRFRRLRTSTVHGTGKYGMRHVAAVMCNQPALGDDSGFDFASLIPAINAGATGAANIIAAERATPSNLFPTTSPAGGTINPYAISPYASVPPPGSSILPGISSNSLPLLLLIGVVAVVASEGKH